MYEKFEPWKDAKYRESDLPKGLAEATLIDEYVAECGNGKTVDVTSVPPYEGEELLAARSWSPIVMKFDSWDEAQTVLSKITSSIPLQVAIVCGATPLIRNAHNFFYLMMSLNTKNLDKASFIDGHTIAFPDGRLFYFTTNLRGLRPDIIAICYPRSLPKEMKDELNAEFNAQL